jgi:hypothetical protein
VGRRDKLSGGVVRLFRDQSQKDEGRLERETSQRNKRDYS